MWNKTRFPQSGINADLSTHRTCLQVGCLSELRGESVTGAPPPPTSLNQSQPPASMAPSDWPSGLSVRSHLPTQALLTWHQDADPAAAAAASP